jgi:hypothetical protein
MPRWPLALIGAPAAVAVWSGWVGLGQLCGFGVIHPLPGIWDAATINTAITLPIGVEAYGAYALGAWLTPGTSERARTFARRSAIGSLALGMLGQVAYHLLAALHATSAPWAVTMFVSCLPVVALALGTALAHLLRERGEEVPSAEGTAETVAAVIPTAPATVPETVAKAVPGETAGNGPSVPDSGPVDVPAHVPLAVPQVAPVAHVRAHGSTRPRSPRQPVPERVFAAEIKRAELLSLRTIKARMHVGTDRARLVRDQLVEILRRVPEAA